MLGYDVNVDEEGRTTDLVLLAGTYGVLAMVMALSYLDCQHFHKDFHREDQYFGTQFMILPTRPESSCALCQGSWNDSKKKGVNQSQEKKEVFQNNSHVLKWKINKTKQN